MNKNNSPHGQFSTPPQYFHRPSQQQAHPMTNGNTMHPRIQVSYDNRVHPVYYQNQPYAQNMPMANNGIHQGMPQDQMFHYQMHPPAYGNGQTFYQNIQDRSPRLSNEKVNAHHNTLGDRFR